MTPEPDIADSERWLTAAGRAHIREVAMHLAETGVHIDRIVTSPFVRAAQTAELVAGQLGYRGEIQTIHGVTPEASVGAAIDTLSTLGDNVLVTTHQPFVSQFVMAKTGQRIEFSTGTIAAIEGDKLLWAHP